MDIYWSTTFQSMGGEMSFLPPTSLWDDLTSKYDDGKADLYFRCPAAINELRRTFVVRSGLPINITYNDNVLEVNGHEDHIARELVVPLSDDGILFNFGPGLLLFSDQRVNITQTPCYHHKSPLDHVYSPSGTYDIGSWFRPLVTPVVNSNHKSMNIRRGDPIYYFRVNTDEKIKLKQFELSPKLTQYAMDSISYKLIQNNKTLNALYEAFNVSKRRNLVLSEIKKNLID